MSHAIDEADIIAPERLAGAVVDDLMREAKLPREERRRWTVREMRQAIEFEAQLVAVAASNVAQGILLSPADIHRLWVAADRIRSILEAMR